MNWIVDGTMVIVLIVSSNIVSDIFPANHISVVDIAIVMAVMRIERMVEKCSKS